MLDAETKRKIDNCRDILVGKIPDPKSQVEQITIALIYKFMDDMDQDSVDQGGKPSFFTGNFQKYSWSNIFDRRLGGHEILNLYSEALVKMNQNPNIPQLFRDIFKNVTLPYRDPETLRLFLKEISGFIYDHSERLGDAFEYLLSVLGSQGKAGQFRTPRHIIDFIVEIVAPQKHETVLDPACGTAGFLISAYKHILKNNPNLSISQKHRLMNNLTGYDISYDMVRLSLVNMYLHGFPDPDPQIHEYDTLTYEDKWGETFDVIMANPPFMSPKGGIRPHSRFSVKANRSEVLFVDYIAEHLNPSGRAGVIVPEGIVFTAQNAYKQLRKMLVENYLWAVVSLPAGVFNPYAGVKTNILLMDKSLAKRIDKILFVKIENDGFDLGAQRRQIDKDDLPAAQKYLNIYKSKIINYKSKIEDSPFAHAVLKSEIAKSSDYNLSGDRYRIFERAHTTKYEMVEIEKLTELFVDGDWVETKDQSSEGIRLIQTGNVGFGEYLDKSDKSRFITNEKYHELNCTEVFPGDVLVSRLPDPVGRACIVPNLACRMITAVDCTIIRFQTNKLIPRLFVYYTKSDVYYKELYQYLTGSSRERISRSNLAKVKVPLPPLDVQEKIVAEIDGYQKIIDSARQIVQSYKPTIKINTAWPIVELESVCDFKRGPFGGSLKKEIFVKSGYKVYEQRHAIQDDFDIGNYYISPDKYEEMKDFALNAGDLIISCSGTMGKIAVVPNQFSPGIINQALLKLTPKLDKVLPLFLKISLESDAIQNDYFKNQLGVAIQNVSSVKVLKQIKILLPSLDEQKQIITEIEAEQKIVSENKKLIEIFEKKISDTISALWA